MDSISDWYGELSRPAYDGYCDSDGFPLLPSDISRPGSDADHPLYVPDIVPVAVPAGAGVALASSSSSSSSAGPIRSSRNRGRRESALTAFILVWNNAPQDADDKIRSWPDVRYAVWQWERGASGTLHVQGYLQFSKRKRLNQLKALARTAHFEPARGSPEENRVYCTKEESRVREGGEIGEMVMERQRTDLQTIAKKVLDGVPMKVLAQENPDAIVRYGKGLQTLSRYRNPPAMMRDVHCALFIGPTGTGKTWDAVHSVENEEDIYLKDTGKWFDNYIGQKVVVFDDFAGAASHISLAESLRMFDGYRYQVEVKGGYEWLAAELVIVTTNIPMVKWFKWEDRAGQYAALARRFKEVRVYASRGNFERYVGDEAFAYLMRDDPAAPIA